MAPNGPGSEWERWRGDISRRVEDHEEDLRKLWEVKDEVAAATAEWRERVAKKITAIETKIAGFAALGAIAGGLIATFIERMFK